MLGPWACEQLIAPENVRQYGNELAPVFELLDLDVTADSLVYSGMRRNITEKIDHGISKWSTKDLGVDLAADIAFRAGTNTHAASFDLGLSDAVDMRLDMDEDVEDERERASEVVDVRQLLRDRLRLLARWNRVDRHGKRNVLSRRHA